MIRWFQGNREEVFCLYVFFFPTFFCGSVSYLGIIAGLCASWGLRERFLNLGKILFGKTAEMCMRSLNMGLLRNACVMY